jgi:hypothetical protein
MLTRFRLRRPALRLDAVVGSDKSRGAVIRELIEPNIDAFDFTHTLRMLTPRLRTIYYPVGRKLVRGAGVAFAEAPSPPRYNLPVYNVEAEYVENKEIYNEYADYFVARARDAEEQGDNDAAARYFRQGYDLVPWCVPCLDNACRLEHGAGVECGN